MKSRIALWAVGLLAVLVGLLAACAAPQPTQTAPATTPTRAARGYIRLTPEQLYNMLANKDFVLVNVHVPYNGEIAQTDLFIPYNELSRQLGKFPDKTARIVVYCRSGPMSTSAAQTLAAAGYTNVMELAGGMSAWEAAGYTLVRK